MGYGFTTSGNEEFDMYLIKLSFSPQDPLLITKKECLQFHGSYIKDIEHHYISSNWNLLFPSLLQKILIINEPKRLSEFFYKFISFARLIAYDGDASSLKNAKLKFENNNSTRVVGYLGKIDFKLELKAWKVIE